jgi:hypothetical protein
MKHFDVLCHCGFAVKHLFNHSFEDKVTRKSLYVEHENRVGHRSKKPEMMWSNKFQLLYRQTTQK